MNYFILKTLLCTQKYNMKRRKSISYESTQKALVLTLFLRARSIGLEELEKTKWFIVATTLTLQPKITTQNHTCITTYLFKYNTIQRDARRQDNKTACCNESCNSTQLKRSLLTRNITTDVGFNFKTNSVFLIFKSHMFNGRQNASKRR